MEQSKITVPDSWDEINIETLQELSRAKSIYDKISIIIDQDPEYIKKFDTDTFNRLSNALGWIHSFPGEDQVKKLIVVDGLEYGLIDRFSSFLLGQWMDIEEYLKEPIENIHKIMALFYRPVLTTLRDGSLILDDYDSKEAKVRAEVFKTHMKVSDAYSALVFFSLIEKESLKTIQVYFQVDILRMKIEQEKRNLKESKEKPRRKGLLNGLGGHLRTTWLKGI